MNARSHKSHHSLSLLLVAMMVALSNAAHARPEFVDVLLKTYSPKSDSDLFKAAKSCVSCHDGGPPKLNVYGKDVKAALSQSGSRNLTPAILQTIESKDSNGDGASNGDSLKAGNNPAVADAKPTGITPTKGQPEAKPAEVATESPFSPKSILMPKHANHPVVVHFPVALFMIGLLFDLLAVRQKKPLLIQVGYYNLLVAAISTIPTIITGITAWQWAYGGAALTGYLLYHLCLAIVTSITLITLWRMRAKRQDEVYQGVNTTYFILAFIALILVATTGHLGGILTFGS